MKVRLGTRGSRLALWQARRVADLIRNASPGIGVELVIIKTTGDERSEFGGDSPEQVGEFSSELERELSTHGIDAAVHSAKDLPTRTPENLMVAAYPERGDPRDGLIRKIGGSEYPPAGSVVATGSPRRAMIWQERWSHTTTQGIRGNVDQRMEKLKKDSSLWGLVLASAGVDRLGGVPEGLIMDRLDPDWMVPAPAQAALAVECRADDRKIRNLFEKIDNPRVRCCVEAEKVFLQRWGGGCSESLGVLATLEPRGTLHLQAAVKGVLGEVRRAQMEGPASESVRLGIRLAEEMRGG